MDLEQFVQSLTDEQKRFLLKVLGKESDIFYDLESIGELVDALELSL